MQFEQILHEKLGKGGVFLLAGDTDRNGMTIGWGFSGVMWGKDILIVPVRTSRHTYTLLQKHKTFCVCVPKVDMKKELAYFGSKSGRDTDKFADMNLSPLPCQNIDTFCLPNCYVFECQLVYQNTLNPSDIFPPYEEKWYAENNPPHAMLYGEVIAVYEK